MQQATQNKTDQNCTVKLIHSNNGKLEVLNNMPCDAALNTAQNYWETGGFSRVEVICNGEQLFLKTKVTVKPPNKLLAVMVIIVSLSLFAASCAPSGYGCKGRGKIITRVR